MCTSRLLTISRSTRGWGVYPGGGIFPEGVYLERVMSARGAGVCPKECWDTHTPLWTEFLTHACENITFLQLPLRAPNEYPFLDYNVKKLGYNEHPAIRSTSLCIKLLIVSWNFERSFEIVDQQIGDQFSKLN